MPPRISPIRRAFTCTVVAALPALGIFHARCADASEKPRIIATTDGEIDDRCSMIRFLAYANEWDIQGIIHSSSKFHWKGDATHEEKDWEPVEWLDRQLDAYAESYPNLMLHDATFPTPDALRALVYVGNIGYEGDMDAATPGSDRIVEVLLEADDSPVWLQAWGGANTIARALKTIKEQHPGRVAEVSRKARLFLIAEQDKTLRDYIIPEWPEVEVLLSDWSSFEIIAYPWQKLMTEEQQSYFDAPWMGAHILKDHGPLNAMYESKKGRFRSEGDTPSFFHVINTGLRGHEHPTFGGWGGRFKRDNGVWLSVDERGGPVHSIGRWAIDFQNDWAARADWFVKPYAEANHPPQVVLSHDSSLSGKPGASISLNAANSTDPDGHALNYQWWHFVEAGTAKSSATIDTADQAEATLHIPEDARPGETLHAICTVRDAGDPVLTRHARVVVTVE